MFTIIAVVKRASFSSAQRQRFRRTETATSQGDYESNLASAVNRAATDPFRN
jgi:hypothetical protein